MPKCSPKAATSSRAVSPFHRTFRAATASGASSVAPRRPHDGERRAGNAHRSPRTRRATPRLSADLSSPIGERTWTSAFLPVLAHVCLRHRLEPRVVAGHLGRWLQESLATVFAREVDFATLRQEVQQYLAPDPAVLALTQRVFGESASAEQFNWVASNAAAVETGKLIPHPRAWR
jgi:hypothetical protein